MLLCPRDRVNVRQVRLALLYLWIYTAWLDRRCILSSAFRSVIIKCCQLVMVVFLPFTTDTFDEGTVFSVCPSAAFARSFVQTDTVTTVSHERLEQSRWNLHGITVNPYWWLFRFWRSEVKVTAGCRGGGGIHVDAGGAEVYLLVLDASV